MWRGPQQAETFERCKGYYRGIAKGEVRVECTAGLLLFLGNEIPNQAVIDHEQLARHQSHRKSKKKTILLITCTIPYRTNLR